MTSSQVISEPHLVLPGGDVPGGAGHVNVGGDHDAQPGGLRRHGVGVDLAHVQTPVIQGHGPEYPDVQNAQYLHAKVTHLMWRLKVVTKSPLTETPSLWVMICSPMAWIALVSALTQPT